MQTIDPVVVYIVCKISMGGKNNAKMVDAFYYNLILLCVYQEIVGSVRYNFSLYLFLMLVVIFLLLRYYYYYYYYYNKQLWLFVLLNNILKDFWKSSILTQIFNPGDNILLSEIFAWNDGSKQGCFINMLIFFSYS